ncbi:MAG: Na+/H+ antiporter [Candidatus Eremiobacteraeota bacterium]|nr:Na+/H+ antiporter [Candidatus Eremiobacteraeota bacterium]MBV8263805.1 Na+/H+ antiporter [Candidatus Eremiobacteraeota bacterium]
MGTFLLILGLIVVLVGIANRIGIAWPIVLVLSGMAIGYIPNAPALSLPPDLVLVVFLPPLLYWESVTAPTGEFVSGAWWIFQLAVGLVIVTTVAVAVVAHALVPALGWAAAFVLGAAVSSTDEVAFAPIVERLRIPRHVVATIEGESLVNDATSLVLYGIAVVAVVSGTFSWSHTIELLVLGILGGVAVGMLVGVLTLLAWHFIKDDLLQPMIALISAFGSYLLASRVGASGVLAVVTVGVLVARYAPLLFGPISRIRGVAFLSTFSFLANSVIFLLVGMQFHPIVQSLSQFSIGSLIWYGLAVSLTVIIIRFLWTFAQGLLPFTNEPEHAEGKADWSHVAVLAWSGMRGGVSLAAALAIPFETATGPFPGRNLIIYLTFCVLLATLVGQAGTLPLLIRWFHITDDGTDAREERLALAKTARAALTQIERLREEGNVPAAMLDALKKHFGTRWQEFAATDSQAAEAAAKSTSLYRKLQSDLLQTQRTELIALRNRGKIDNTVMRRIQMILDFETAELEILGSAGHANTDVAAPD